MLFCFDYTRLKSALNDLFFNYRCWKYRPLIANRVGFEPRVHDLCRRSSILIREYTSSLVSHRF